MRTPRSSGSLGGTPRSGNTPQWEHPAVGTPRSGNTPQWEHNADRDKMALFIRIHYQVKQLNSRHRARSYIVRPQTSILLHSHPQASTILNMVSWTDLLGNAVEISSEVVVADGLSFGESPRYSQTEGIFYMSDMMGKKICSIDDSTNEMKIELEVPNQPNGMAFHPDGSLIFGSMFDNKLFRYDLGTRKSTEFSDLSHLMTGYIGDMVIDKHGRVYVDDVGAKILHGEPPAPGRLIVVRPDGTAKVVAENLQFANGLSIDTTGEKLYLAESWKKSLSEYIVSESGELSDPKVVLDLTDVSPKTEIGTIDGICMDGEDGVWCSMLDRYAFVRRSKTGQITHYVRVDGDATACTLGGKDGKTLIMLTNKSEGGPIFEAMASNRTKCIVSKARVPIGRVRPARKACAPPHFVTTAVEVDGVAWFISYEYEYILYFIDFIQPKTPLLYRRHRTFVNLVMILSIVTYPRTWPCAISKRLNALISAIISLEDMR